MFCPAKIRCATGVAVLFAFTAVGQTQHAKTAGATAPQANTAAPAAAQVEGGTPVYLHPETPEQRMARLGTEVDPGPDPAPTTIFERKGGRFHIERFERKWAAYDRDPGMVRPLSQVNVAFELYQQNDRYIWVWVPEPESAARKAADEKREREMYSTEIIDWAKRMRPEFSELNPPPSTKTIRFEDSSVGLPDIGSWRNSLAVADMNGDGFLDIIAPPQRGAATFLPSIFLGDGKGHWQYWRDVTWPGRIDYGGVVAADFNRDGHMDLAFATHLQGIHVWLGDGKGHFTDSSKGLPVMSFPSRKIVVTDLNGDGVPDLVAVSEGPTARGDTAVAGAKILGFINHNKGTKWEPIEIVGAGRDFAGDTLAVGNFNGDRRPDFAGGSIYFMGAEHVFLSNGKKPGWSTMIEGTAIIPYMSGYSGVAAGHFTSKRLDDLVFTYSRQWPAIPPSIVEKPTIERLGGIDLVRFTGKEPSRKSLVRFAGSRQIMGVATGDFDGDGNLDIVYVAWEPKREFVILLGDGKGGFTRANLEGIEAAPQTNYDVTVADVNGDGRPDIIIGYESDERSSFGKQNGSIHVFLNRGVVKKTVDAAGTNAAH